MADITDLLGLGVPGGGVFNIEPQQSPLASYLGASNIPTPEQPHHSKLRNTLGAIGDAMLVATGHAPIYRQRMEQEQQNQALQGFLQNPDEAIQRLMQIDPRSGIALYSQVHPKSEVPESVKGYNYYNALPDSEKPRFEKYLQLTHPGMMAPVTLGPNDTVETPGSSLPHVSDQASYDAVPAGAQYTTPDGHVRVKGGATASTPSPTFR